MYHYNRQSRSGGGSRHRRDRGGVGRQRHRSNQRGSSRSRSRSDHRNSNNNNNNSGDRNNNNRSEIEVIYDNDTRLVPHHLLVNGGGMNRMVVVVAEIDVEIIDDVI